MPFIYKGLAHVSNRNTLRPNIKIFSNWERSLSGDFCSSEIDWLPAEID